MMTSITDIKDFTEARRVLTLMQFWLEGKKLVVEAAQNLVKVRGRHNTEIAFNKLKEAVEAYGKN
jgi:hypothetical protein